MLRQRDSLACKLIYVHYVWEMVQAKKQEVKLDKFFGFLTFKYKMHQTTSHDHLQNLQYT